MHLSLQLGPADIDFAKFLREHVLAPTELRYLLLLPAVSPLLYYCLAIFSAWDYFTRIKKLRSSTPRKLPPVSILKPACGLEREFYENFASMCGLDYPEYEIVFAVGDPNDPVVGLIDRLRRDF